MAERIPETLTLIDNPCQFETRENNTEALVENKAKRNKHDNNNRPLLDKDL